ncbi:MAG: cadmium resistance transporter [Terracidiphilus sp.]|jgi:cadmium resistance protein CadD (predicted permease)
MEIIGLAVVVFASTNVDDLLVLVAFFADPQFGTREVVLGQYAGIAVLFALGYAGSLLALVIPHAYIGLLGIIAIALGVKKLFALGRNEGQSNNLLERHDDSLSQTHTVTVALVTMANGADNIGVYLPTFAVQPGHAIGVFAIVFLVLTGLWCFLAHWLVFHSTFGSQIRRFANRITPFVLIGLGVLIMLQAGTFGLIHGLN